MKINCLGCGHMFDIGDCYDDYDGSIKCNICGATLDLKSKGGNLKSVKLVANRTWCSRHEC